MRKTNALYIAKLLINKCRELDRRITNLKLQKLLYFAQGHFIQENNGSLLFEEDFQAWAHGPVVPVVYEEFEKYMWFSLPYQENVPVPEDKLDNFLNKLLRYYGAPQGRELEITSHGETPWKKARLGIGDYVPSLNKIEKRDIIESYKIEKVGLDVLAGL